MIAAYAVVTSAVCGFLEVRTFLVYRRMNAKMKFERRHEYRLLRKFRALTENRRK